MPPGLHPCRNNFSAATGSIFLDFSQDTNPRTRTRKRKNHRGLQLLTYLRCRHCLYRPHHRCLSLLALVKVAISRLSDLHLQGPRVSVYRPLFLTETLPKMQRSTCAGRQGGSSIGSKVWTHPMTTCPKLLLLPKPFISLLSTQHLVQEDLELHLPRVLHPRVKEHHQITSTTRALPTQTRSIRISKNAAC